MKARQKYKKNIGINKFRGTQAWKNKREEIKKRDNYVCQACIRNAEGAQRRYETDNLSVHHIVPIEEDYSLRLENDNLITLCDIHHEMAEKGILNREKLREMTEGIPPG
jgi:5-methylcytosine-specific restriction endonuclease McrA